MPTQEPDVKPGLGVDTADVAKALQGQGPGPESSTGQAPEGKPQDSADGNGRQADEKAKEDFVPMSRFEEVNQRLHDYENRYRGLEENFSTIVDNAVNRRLAELGSRPQEAEPEFQFDRSDPYEAKMEQLYRYMRERNEQETQALREEVARLNEDRRRSEVEFEAGRLNETISDRLSRHNLPDDIKDVAHYKSLMLVQQGLEPGEAVTRTMKSLDSYAKSAINDYVKGKMAPKAPVQGAAPGAAVVGAPRELRLDDGSTKKALAEWLSSGAAEGE